MSGRSDLSMPRSLAVAVSLLGVGVGGYWLGHSRENGSPSWISDITVPPVPRGEFSIDLVREEMRRCNTALADGDLESSLMSFGGAVAQFNALFEPDRIAVSEEMNTLVGKLFPELVKTIKADPARIDLLEYYEKTRYGFKFDPDHELYALVSRQYLVRAKIGLDEPETRSSSALVELDEAQRCAELAGINIEKEMREILEVLFVREPQFKKRYLAIEKNLRDLKRLSPKLSDLTAQETVKYLDRALRKEVYGERYHFKDYLRAAVTQFELLDQRERRMLSPTVREIATRAVPFINSEPGVSIQTEDTGTKDLLTRLNRILSTGQ